MNATLIVVGALLGAQAALYAFGGLRFGSRLGPRLASYRRSDRTWRAGLRALAPLQLLAGGALVYGGATSSRADNAPLLAAAIALTLLGTYFGHRAAAKAASPT